MLRPLWRLGAFATSVVGTDTVEAAQAYTQGEDGGQATCHHTGVSLRCVMRALLTPQPGSLCSFSGATPSLNHLAPVVAVSPRTGSSVGRGGQGSCSPPDREGAVRRAGEKGGKHVPQTRQSSKAVPKAHVDTERPRPAFREQ